MPRPAVPSTLVRRPGAAPRRPAPVRSAVALLAVVAATVLTTACSGDDASQPPTATQPATTTTTTGGAADTTTTTTEPTTTTAAPTPEEEVKTAYLEASASYFNAARTANPDDPQLAETRAGPSLARAQELLAGFRTAGVTAVYVDDQPPIPTIEAVEIVGPDKAFVSVCLVDNGRQVRKSDGVVVDDSVLSRLDKGEMRRIDGAWRLFELEGLQRWKDGQGCDR